MKASTLILSVASGLAIGKEGPYVHIASAIANVVARQSPKHAGSTHREMLGAGAASGIAVAFGAPISGVFFALEEVSYYFPSKVLLPTLAASTIAATSLRVFNGTDKTVVFLSSASQAGLWALRSSRLHVYGLAMYGPGCFYNVLRLGK